MITADLDAPDVDRFAVDVGKLPEALGDFRTASAEAATMVLGDVRPPRATGTLASTVEAVPEGLGFTLRAGGPKAPYGPIVHARDPFLTRPVQARADDVLGVYADDVEDTINRTIHT